MSYASLLVVITDVWTGGETIKNMQGDTGCKINVSPATGQDYEREIGLVGSRAAIERAKNAIMEKVHAVVSLIIPPTSQRTTDCHVAREE